MPVALDAAPATEELELADPGGGGPGDIDNYGRYGGGGGGGDDHEGSRFPLQRLGILLGTASIFSFFATLCLVFVARSRTLFFWAPITVPKTLWLSTALLLLSSGSIESARRALSRRNVRAYRNRLLATSFLGLAFLGCQCAGMYDLAKQGFYARENPHASLFYLFTGIHGAHLLVGLIALNWLVLHGRKQFKQEMLSSGNVAFYWHFMDVIWLGLFALLLAL